MSLGEFDKNNETLKEKRKICLIAGSFFLVILLIFFGVGCFLLVRQIQASRYKAIKAVVVDYRIVYTNDSESIEGSCTEATYLDVVEYEINGQKYLKTCDTPASRKVPPNDMGKIITIYVNPNNPDDVVFRNTTHVILTVGCLVVPALGFVAIGFVFRRAHKIKKML